MAALLPSLLFSGITMAFHTAFPGDSHMKDCVITRMKMGWTLDVESDSDSDTVTINYAFPGFSLKLDRVVENHSEGAKIGPIWTPNVI